MDKYLWERIQIFLSRHDLLNLRETSQFHAACDWFGPGWTVAILALAFSCSRRPLLSRGSSVRPISMVRRGHRRSAGWLQVIRQNHQWCVGHPQQSSSGARFASRQRLKVGGLSALPLAAERRRAMGRAEPVFVPGRESEIGVSRDSHRRRH